MCSYLYLKLGKTVGFSYYLLCFFSSTNIREQEVRIGSAGKEDVLTLMGWVGGEESGRKINTVQIMCAHVCKCKNDSC
jgi:hypothetical protein